MRLLSRSQKVRRHSAMSVQFIDGVFSEEEVEVIDVMRTLMFDDDTELMSLDVVVKLEVTVLPEETMAAATATPPPVDVEDPRGE